MQGNDELRYGNFKNLVLSPWWRQFLDIVKGWKENALESLVSWKSVMHDDYISDDYYRAIISNCKQVENCIDDEMKSLEYSNRVQDPIRD